MTSYRAERARRRAAAVLTALLPTALVVSAVAAPALATPPVTAPGVTSVQYLVLPHPDDEFEVWSQVQDTPDVFKVFVLLTHGEQSAHCEPAGAGDDAAVDQAPSPTPQGRFTASCEQARLGAWRGFLADMAATDPSVPGTFTDRGTLTFPAAPGDGGCRLDGEPGACARRTSAHRWSDDGGHGALVVFDLGDGDLTPAEVVWALGVVREHRAALGIDTSLPSRGVVGSYATSDHGDGFRYGHPDHLAVAAALAGTDLHLGPQLGATAAGDPAAVVVGDVSATALSTAFGPEGGAGAHARRYGWLWRDDADPVTGGRVDAYQVDRTGQRRLFHVRQHFWRAFASAGAPAADR